MCIRDDWLVDISPLAEASASYKHMLDADCFTQTTFPVCNLIHSVGKEQSRCSASGVPYQNCSTIFLERSVASSTR